MLHKSSQTFYTFASVRKICLSISVNEIGGWKFEICFFFLFFFSLASRLFFGCLQLRIQTAFETLPFIRYVCVCVCVRRCIYTESTHSGGREEQAEEEEEEEDEVGGWEVGKWESICRIKFIDPKGNGAECIHGGAS